LGHIQERNKNIPEELLKLFLLLGYFKNIVLINIYRDNINDVFRLQ